MKMHDDCFFFRECLSKFGDTLGKEVWDAIKSVFDVLPLAAVIDDKVFKKRSSSIEKEILIKKNHFLHRFFVFTVAYQVL